MHPTAQAEAKAAPRIDPRTTCRVCSAPLRTVLDLGEQFPQGSFVKPDAAPVPLRRLPLELARCTNAECTLAQLRHTVPAPLLYETYWYRSRINDTMRAHLRTIANSSVAMVGGSPDRVLDIGCNDGTLLENFRGLERWGVEPSNAIEDVHDDVTLVRGFFPDVDLSSEAGRFDIVTSIAVFYDIEDPVSFARAVRELLAPAGVWTLEVGYLPTILESLAYDSICHEHLTYYSLRSLRRVLDAAGLDVVHAERNDVNGGSLCCHVMRRGTVADESVAAIEQEELSQGLDDDAVYARFAQRVRGHRDQLSKLLRDLREQERTVHVYGASTKGNTLLQYCGIDREIVPYAAERNEDKVGARTPGTNIEILSESASRALGPDYYLVLPWHFRAEIVNREAEMLDAGCQLIFPLPTVDILRKEA